MKKSLITILAAGFLTSAFAQEEKLSQQALANIIASAPLEVELGGIKIGEKVTETHGDESRQTVMAIMHGHYLLSDGEWYSSQWVRKNVIERSTQGPVKIKSRSSFFNGGYTGY